MQLIPALFLILADLYLIILVLRLFLDPRMFHFSPFLQSLKQLTDPVVEPLSRALGSERRAILAAGILVIVLTGLILGFLAPEMLVFSVSSMVLTKLAPVAPLLCGVLLSVAYVMDYVTLLLFIAMAVTALIEPYTVNPISRAMFRVVEVWEDLFAVIIRPEQKIWQRRLIGGAVLILINAAAHLVLHLLVALLMGDTVPILGQIGLCLFSALSLIATVLRFFTVLLLVSVFMSWLSPDPTNPLVGFITAVSYPLLAPFRRYIPMLGPIDISPIFALLVFEFARTVYLRLLSQLFTLF